MIRSTSFCTIRIHKREMLFKLILELLNKFTQTTDMEGEVGVMSKDFYKALITIPIDGS